MVGAIGKRALSVDLVPTSRAEADRAMRVLLGQDTGYDVAQLDDIRAHANLLELLDVLRERPHLQEGRLEPLITGDNQRGRVLLETCAPTWTTSATSLRRRGPCRCTPTRSGTGWVGSQR